MKTYHKGFIAPLLLALIALLLIGGGAYVYMQKNQANQPITATSTTKTSNSQTASWKTYTNTTYGYEIKYPTSGFRLTEITPVYVAIVPIESNAALNITITKQSKTTLSDEIDKFLHTYPTITVTSRSTVIINGTQLIKLAYRDTAGDGPATNNFNYFILKNGYLYSLRYIDTSKTDNDSFESIIRTFKLN